GVKALATGYASGPDEKDLRRCVQLVFRHCDDVGVEPRLRHDLLALDRFARGEELVAPPRRVLELEPFCGVVHLAVQTGQCLLDLAVEEGTEAVDVAAVVLVGDLADARTRTPPDVEVQTRASEPVALVEQRFGT